MLELLVEGIPEKFNKKDNIKIRLSSKNFIQETLQTRNKERAVLSFSKKCPAFFNYSDNGISIDFSITDGIDHILVEIPRNNQFTEIMGDKEIEDFFIRYIYSDLDEKIKDILKGFKTTLIRKRKVKEDLSKNFSYKETNILYSYCFNDIDEGVFHMSHETLDIDIIVTIWKSVVKYGSVFFAIEESDEEKKLIKENIVYNYFTTTNGY